MATIILRIRLHRLEDKELVVVYEEEMGGKTRKYIVHVIIGNAVLCGIYFLDYTWIARHAKKIGVALMAACILASVFGINIVNGNIYWPLYISGHYIFMKAFILLYVPVYGGIIYHYHGSVYSGLAVEMGRITLQI